MSEEGDDYDLSGTTDMSSGGSMAGENFFEGLDETKKLAQMARGDQIDRLQLISQKISHLNDRATQLEEAAHSSQIERWISMFHYLEPFCSHEALREPTNELKSRTTRITDKWKTLKVRCRKLQRLARDRDNIHRANNDESIVTSMSIASGGSIRESRNLSPRSHFEFLRRKEARKNRERFVLARQNSEKFRRLRTERESVTSDRRVNFGGSGSGTAVKRLTAFFPELPSSEIEQLVLHHNADNDSSGFDMCILILKGRREFVPSCAKLKKAFPEILMSVIEDTLRANAGLNSYNATFDALLAMRENSGMVGEESLVRGRAGSGMAPKIHVPSLVHGKSHADVTAKKRASFAQSRHTVNALAPGVNLQTKKNRKSGEFRRVGGSSRSPGRSPGRGSKRSKSPKSRRNSQLSPKRSQTTLKDPVTPPEMSEAIEILVTQLHGEFKEVRVSKIRDIITRHKGHESNAGMKATHEALTEYQKKKRAKDLTKMNDFL